MDGKIVYTAGENSLRDELQAEMEACRYHLVDARTKEVVEGYDRYDDAVDGAKIRASIKGRPYYVVDTGSKTRSGGHPERKRRGWLGRLLHGEGA